MNVVGDNNKGNGYPASTGLTISILQSQLCSNANDGDVDLIGVLTPTVTNGIRCRGVTFASVKHAAAAPIYDCKMDLPCIPRCIIEIYS
jgi:hypothetical protein